MAVRATMAALITRVRLLINDPAGAAQQFADQDIQDVLDASRQNMRYLSLAPAPTYSGATISYLDYYSDLGDWEDDATFWQYRILSVTPSASEPIVGHWTFALTTLPPVFLIGKTYDVYRGAADLLERLAAQWTMRYSMTVDGQSLQRGQVTTALQTLAMTYRRQQRAGTLRITRSDIASRAQPIGLGPQAIDYQGSGDGR